MSKELSPNTTLSHYRIITKIGAGGMGEEAVPQAKAAAKRALEIYPTLAEAHTFLAYSLVVYDWNWEEAEREFKRGIEFDPNNSPAHFRYGQS